MVKNVNIRASSIREFWGDTFSNDIYLFEGARHHLTLSEIDADTYSALPDKYDSIEKTDKAMQTCKQYYQKLLPVLSEKLNTYHQQNLSTHFWQIAFGYWLYRHICIVYEKFQYLSDINIDTTGIKLLAPDNFYIPKDSIEHFELFANDFGVQQLVSEYYYLFASANFEKIKYSFRPLNSDTIPRQKHTKKKLSLKAPDFLKKILKGLIQPKIVLLNTYIEIGYLKKIMVAGKGRIMPIELPEVVIRNTGWDIEKRKAMFSNETSNRLDNYLLNSFIHGLPTIFLENFKTYYTPYLAHIRSNKFKKIISEGWMGRNNVAIYCAISNEIGREFIMHEHATSCSLVKRSFQWLYFSLPNRLITIGWKSKETKVLKGAFLAKKPFSYSFSETKKQILYVSQSTPPYLIEFGWHAANYAFLNTLRKTRKLISLLPKELKSHFKYRPRKDITLWDTAHTLELNATPEMIDLEGFHDSINNSRIVIIDHFSTTITELLLAGVPFLLLINSHFEMADDVEPIIKNMEQLGIAHYSVNSLVMQLTKVYKEVKPWWSQKEVVETIESFKNAYLALPQEAFNLYNVLLEQTKS